MAEAAAERRAMALAVLLFWTTHFLLIAIRGALHDWTLDPVDLNLRRLAVHIVGALLSWVMVLLLSPLRARPVVLRIPAAILLVPVSAALFGLTNDLVFQSIRPPEEALTMLMFWQDMFPWIGSFAAWAAIMAALDYAFLVRDRERRLAELGGLARDAQMQALRHQLNPHFLFNTLNSISSLIWERAADRAEAMVVALSAFLRATLDLDPTGDIALADELALQQRYLAIEQIRFPDRLAVSIDAPADTLDARVPSLILQPLVENAVKHGVARSTAPVSVTITAARAGGQLVLTVADDGRGTGTAPGSGLGLALVRRRLEAHFGEAGALVSGPASGGGHLARLTLPWVTA